MSDSHQQTKFNKKRFFGAAMFLRPEDKNLGSQIRLESIDTIIESARKNPDKWQCLLMKRNYLDYCWDHIGGNCEENEFPFQTMKREVFEEVGWEVQYAKEVCRQWTHGILNGFVYAVIPTEANYMEDSPPRIPCFEVQTVEYFNLDFILKSEQFKMNVKGRIKAFISGEPDFSLQ